MISVEEIRAALRDYSPGRLRLPLAGDDIDQVDWDSAKLTPAAVLVPVVAHEDGPSVLLTLRHSGLSRHAGQVAFPGGRIDPGETAIEAALREADEEIDLPPGLVEVIATLDDYATGTNYRVTPVVGIVPPDVPLTPHEAEVESVFEVPLAHLIDPANHHKKQGEWRGRQRSYYEIDWQPQTIWGATAGMIVNLSRILGQAA